MKKKVCAVLAATMAVGTVASTGVDVKADYYDLSGRDRYETANLTAKVQFESKKAESVVIVGGNAIMDGLSAAPLATAKKAPVLLASMRNGLSKDTIDTIRDISVDLKGKDVYIVGGVESAPESVEEQLKANFGCNVIRISGMDRYDTSLEIMKEMHNNKMMSDNFIFFVGGNGAADAMSIAPVACTYNFGNGPSPILVVNKKGLSSDAKKFIKDNLKFKYGVAVGGENTLSKQVGADINSVSSESGTGDKYKTISGIDRYDTNAMIIDTFYTTAVANYTLDGKLVTGDLTPVDDSFGLSTDKESKIVVSGLAVTSGKNNYLVDAQVAAGLAADNQLPILLVGNGLENSQTTVLKNKVSGMEAVDSGNGTPSARTRIQNVIRSNIFTIGSNVSSDTMANIHRNLGI